MLLLSRHFVRNVRTTRQISSNHAPIFSSSHKYLVNLMSVVALREYALINKCLFCRLLKRSKRRFPTCLFSPQDSWLFTPNACYVPLGAFRDSSSFCAQREAKLVDCIKRRNSREKYETKQQERKK